MKTMQGGKISGGLLSLLGVLTFGVGLLVVTVASYASAKNYGAATEASLRAAQDDSRNVFAQAGQKIREVAQVPGMYADDVERVTRAAIEGRYGPDGSKAVFQWLQENNPQLGDAVYLKVQQVIEASRDDFKLAQRRQIDVRRQYEAQIDSFWRGFWLGQAGYPKVKLADFDIVSTQEADDVFRAKKEAGPIDLRP